MYNNIIYTNVWLENRLCVPSRVYMGYVFSDKIFKVDNTETYMKP